MYLSLLTRIISFFKFDSSTKMGYCIASASCATTGSVTCFSTDLGNKQGPVCFVGQFNGARIVACAIGQNCAVANKKKTFYRKTLFLVSGQLKNKLLSYDFTVLPCYMYRE